MNSEETLTRWQDPTIDMLKKEIDKLTAESTDWESKCYKYQEILDKIKEYRKWLDKNTVIYNSGECVKLNGTYWEAEGIKIILDKILEEIE